jgi:hypothetical protein
LGAVEGDDAALWEELQQLGGEATGAAAGVEDGLVAAEVEAGEDFGAPADVRLGNAMIDGGVPFDTVGTPGVGLGQWGLLDKGLRTED